jgi:serine/threonine protein phosphatase 1
MLRRARSLFGGREAPVVSHRIPAGHVVYVVGDLHGRADLLELASRAIADDAAASPALTPLTVFLGDYVDRGAQSADIIERLANRHFPTPIETLLGNHEFMMLRALESDAELERWSQFGGLNTLFSYGVDVRPLQLGTGISQARLAFAAAMPAHHRSFLSHLRLKFEMGDYFFCHAGIRPQTPLAEQVVEDLIWIREAFTASTQMHEKKIVHGHTPVKAAELLPNRINIDTGAYITNLLSVLRLEGDSHEIMAITPRGRAPSAKG